MSDYTQQDWHDLPTTDTPISAERLSHIEAGLAGHAHPADLTAVEHAEVDHAGLPGIPASSSTTVASSDGTVMMTTAGDAVDLSVVGVRKVPDVVQVKAATLAAGAPIAVTLDVAPTVGNLLVAVVGAGHHVDPSLTPGSGWTVGVQGSGLGAGEIHNFLALAWRPVAAGDSAAVTVGTLVSSDVAGTANVAVYELVDADTSAPVAAAVVETVQTGTYPNSGFSTSALSPRPTGLLVGAIELTASDGSTANVSVAAGAIAGTVDTYVDSNVQALATYHGRVAAGSSAVSGGLVADNVYNSGNVGAAELAVVIRGVVATPSFDVPAAGPTAGVGDRLHVWSKTTPTFQYFAPNVAQNFMWRPGTIHDGASVNLQSPDGDGNSDTVVFNEAGDYDLLMRFDLQPQHGPTFVQCVPIVSGGGWVGGDKFMQNFPLTDGVDWQAIFVWKLRLAAGATMQFQCTIAGAAAAEEVGDGSLDITRTK